MGACDYLTSCPVVFASVNNFLLPQAELQFIPRRLLYKTAATLKNKLEAQNANRRIKLITELDLNVVSKSVSSVMSLFGILS